MLSHFTHPNTCKCQECDDNRIKLELEKECEKNKNRCIHIWEPYVGLNFVDEACTKCHILKSKLRKCQCQSGGGDKLCTCDDDKGNTKDCDSNTCSGCKS